MAVKWTAKQQEIIDSRNGDLLVAAAAGSGKTAVLVQHIISQILDKNNPINVDELLVVTFTKAAAAEMRERIAAALDLALEADPDNRHLLKQQGLIQHAHISTIDSFCMWVVKNHYHQLDLDPDFRVADEGEMKLLKAEVLNAMLEECYQDSESSFLPFLEAYTGGKSDDSMREMILRLYEFAQSAPRPEQWLKQCRRPFGMAECLEELPFADKLKENLQRQLKDLAECCDFAIDSFCTDPDVNPKYADVFGEDAKMLEGLLQADTLSELLNGLNHVKFSRRPAMKKNHPNPKAEEKLAAFRDIIKDEVNRLKKRYVIDSPEHMVQAVLNSQESMDILVSLTMEFEGRMKLAKRERNLAEFSDVEHMALELLEGPSPIALDLAHRFREIIVDEYQDSNLVQEQILQSISREPFGEHNRFMVGDVKQSIYKFRMARPELFMEKYESFSYDPGADCRKIDLNRNFRSRSQVLESTNELFYRLMGRDLGGIEYNEEAALYGGDGYPEPEQTGVYDTEILRIEGDEELADSKEWEAKVIADRIREFVDPDTGLKVWDKGAYRPASYGDIVILLRTMSGWSESFLSTLNQEGIPAVADQRSGYFDAREVKLILNMLKIIDNPHQDIPLMSVLVSPIGNFTDEEVALMAAEDRRQTDQIGESRDLYHACLSCDTEKMKAFLSLLESFREKAVYLPIHELIQQILEETGYGHYLLALPSAETRRANIDMLKEKARDFEKTSYHGIFRFVRYIEEIQKYDVDFGEASIHSEQEDRVRILSIHKSKGLEFPIVFVAGTGKSFNRLDASQTVLIHEDLGIASDDLNREYGQKIATLWKRFTADQILADIKSEELRILYVAMTRAKEKLILTGTGTLTKDGGNKVQLAKRWAGEKLPGWLILSGNSYMEWLMMGLAEDCSHFQIREIIPEYVVEDEVVRQVAWDEARKKILQLDPGLIYDKTLRKALKAWKEYRYPCPDDTTRKGTRSVSELKEKGYQEELEGAKPGNVTTASTENHAAGFGALRGTAYHLLLEKIPPEEGTDLLKIRLQLKKFVEKGQISSEVAASIRLEDIRSYYQSSLGKRVTAARKKNLFHVEQPFVMGIPACELEDTDSREMILVQGIIDAYGEDEDGLFLVDYKTDRLQPGEEERLIKRYQVQLELYRKAIEKATGQKVTEGYLYSLSLGKEVRVF